ncbi:MAG: hypothetical protein HQL82_12960 [Magnetococcales bacterium]|nr:hypothetical protein [Magnetococcales bacterium]
MLFGRHENLWLVPQELRTAGETPRGSCTIRKDGREIGVVTSGIGSAQVGLTVEAIVRCGAKRIIGLGFLGSIAPRLVKGTVVVAEAAVRFETASGWFIPDWLPALADCHLRESVVNALQRQGVQPFRALIASIDVPTRELPHQNIHGFFDVAGYDMETSTFYAIAWRYRIPAVTVLLTMDEADRKFYMMDKLEQYQAMAGMQEILPLVCAAFDSADGYAASIGASVSGDPWNRIPPTTRQKWE